MEPLSMIMSAMSIISAILKLAKAIGNKPCMASRIKDKCKSLADYVSTVRSILHAYKDANDTEMMREVLGKLIEALDDAHKLFESCLGGRCSCSHRFDDAKERIENYVGCVMLINSFDSVKPKDELAGRDHPRTNTTADSEMNGTVDENRCKELAERVSTVRNILHEYKEANETEMMREVRGRLIEALDDARKLVEACRGGCCFSSHLDGRRFDVAHSRISNCIHDFFLAKVNSFDRVKPKDELAGRDHPRTNTTAGSEELNGNADKKDVSTNTIAKKNDANKKKDVANDGDAQKKDDNEKKDGNEKKKDVSKNSNDEMKDVTKNGNEKKKDGEDNSGLLILLLIIMWWFRGWILMCLKKMSLKIVVVCGVLVYYYSSQKL